jgi:hypothetical protein
MKIKVTLESTAIEITDNDTAENNYSMAGHAATVKHTLGLVKEICEQVMILNKSRDF